MTTVHVVEPGGRGGVYQHAAALADALDVAGVRVVLHTAADAEEVVGACPRHACFWRCSRVRPRGLRMAAVSAGWLAIGVPSVLARVRPADVVHVEGWFRPASFVPLVVGARLRHARVFLNPHNTFSRRGRRWEAHLVGWMARRADGVFALSDHDMRVVDRWGATTVAAPLVVRPPAPAADMVAAWRRRWAAAGAGPVVLVAGQLRADKGLDTIVRAASQWGHSRVLAVVGQDLGALPAARRLAADLGVSMVVDEGYLPLARFVAAAAAADVVACPYLVASSSAVLALAVALGRPTVASDVGGLGDLATVVVPPGDPDALAAGVERALRAGPVAPPPPVGIDAYLGAYGFRTAAVPG